MYKYQSIANNLNTRDVQGLLDGVLVIQPKLDGSNCQIYKKDGEVVVTSRNNILSASKDNKNCYKTLIADNRFNQFFTKYPDVKLVGEWLVQHKIHYLAGSYHKLYVFDGIELSTENELGKCEYIEYPILTHMLNEFDIECVPYKTIAQADIDGILTNEVQLGNFLLPESETLLAEGFVIKNYQYKNPFGRSVWCKIINHEVYKNNGQKVKKFVKHDNTKENQFINDNLNEHLLTKCYYKLQEDRQLSDFIVLCQREFIEDNPLPEDFNIKQINREVAKRAVVFFTTYKEHGVEQ